MTDAPPPDTESKPERGRALRISIRIGETVAVLGLIFGVATFLVGRQDRAREVRQASEEKAKVEQRQARAAALVLKAEVAKEGDRLLLTPADPEQVIQSQRYVFPRAVREAAREIGAGQPQIEAVWVQDGLRRQAQEGRDAGREPPRGEARLPVAIVTRFIQNGEERTDTTLYRVGYRFDDPLVGRSRVVLLGLSRIRPAEAGPLQAQIDALWGSGAR